MDDTVLDLDKLPEHVAIIMDGNGRWAKKKGKIRLEGHRAGAANLERILEESIKLGVKYLTVYAFSTENWNRSDEEINGIFKLLIKYVDSELDKIAKNNINFQNFGRSRREEDKLNLTMTFKGKEKDIKNFFSDIENEDYDINFSSSYLKITVDKNLLEVKSNLVATVLDKKEDVEIDTNMGDKNIFQSLNLNPKEKEDEKNSYSYMRIGDKTYYRVSAKKENKKKNKKTILFLFLII